MCTFPSLYALIIPQKPLFFKSCNVHLPMVYVYRTRRIRMKYLLQTTTSPLQLQDVNTALLQRGIQLTPEDMRELLRCQQQVLKRCGCIETSSTILKTIIAPFILSPYMSTHNYTSILKNSIIVYYEARKRFDWHIHDEQIIAKLYPSYLLHQGEQNKSYLQYVLLQLQEERQVIHE